MIRHWKAKHNQKEYKLCPSYPRHVGTHWQAAVHIYIYPDFPRAAAFLSGNWLWTEGLIFSLWFIILLCGGDYLVILQIPGSTYRTFQTTGQQGSEKMGYYCGYTPCERIWTTGSFWCLWMPNASGGHHYSRMDKDLVRTFPDPLGSPVFEGVYG